MDDCLKEAIDIVKAQAGVRPMDAGELTALLRNVASGLRDILRSGLPPESATGLSPAQAIREDGIVCLESGREFKMITRRHLAKFGLTPAEYRAKWGYPQDMPLVCESLRRERRRKMQEIRIWERREY